MLTKFIEGVLWVAGTVLVTFFLGHLAWAELQRKHDVAQFKAQHPSEIPYVRLADLPPLIDMEAPAARGQGVAIDYQLAAPDKSLWSQGRIAAFAASLNDHSSEVLGVLEIPRLELEVPLYDGASELNMDRGIARIEGTAWPGEVGNMGIAGHRDGYFRVLKDIKFGDEMIVNSGAGLKRYRVEQLMIVEPSAVDVLDQTENTSITLVTCYPFYFVGHAPQRFIVRAVLQDEV
jgi:LPXTG-site transpeptidase (sortase) family protein